MIGEQIFEVWIKWFLWTNCTFFTSFFIRRWIYFVLVSDIVVLSLTKSLLKIIKILSFNTLWNSICCILTLWYFAKTCFCNIFTVLTNVKERILLEVSPHMFIVTSVHSGIVNFLSLNNLTLNPTLQTNLSIILLIFPPLLLFPFLPRTLTPPFIIPFRQFFSLTTEQLLDIIDFSCTVIFPTSLHFLD